MLLTVRPEDVRLNATAANNQVAVEVVSSVNMGTYTQLQLDVGGQRWQAHAPAGLRLRQGETVTIHLPAQRIWLLPPDEAR